MAAGMAVQRWSRQETRARRCGAPRSSGLLTAAEERRLARAVHAARRARQRLASENPPPDERAALAEAVQAGDRAQARLVAANQGLVWSLALRYQHQGLEIDDLVQEGNVGLLRAIERFDPERGFRFSTYATWWIRQSIVRGIQAAGRLIRLPAHAALELSRLGHAAEAAPTRTDGTVDVGWSAQAVGLTVDRARELLAAAGPTISLDGVLGDDSETTFGDLLADPTADLDAQLDETVRRQALATALAALPERQRRLLALRYGLDGGPPRTLEAVGQALGISRERARQIEVDALRALRRRAAHQLEAVA